MVTWDWTLDPVSVAWLVLAAVGLVLGRQEFRLARRQREESMVMELIRAGQSADATRALHLLAPLPAQADPQAVEGDRDLLFAASTLGILYETWGYMVHRGIIPLEELDGLTGGTVRSAWNKLEPWVVWTRSHGNSPRAYEWFEWLTLQLDHASPARPPS